MPQLKFDIQGPKPEALNDNHTCRTKFEHLLLPHKWESLPETVQERFSRKIHDHTTQTYRGYVVHTRRNFLGTLLANMLRVCGAPLPLDTDNAETLAMVTVTPEDTGDGQVWTRHYQRRGRFPQIIQSAKRFNGPTGLEEYIGYGIGMALKLDVKDSVLTFENDHYFVQLGKFRLRLSRWLAPGDLCVTHADHGDGWFEFGLTLTHRLLGQLLDQSIMFQDMES